MRDEAVGNVLQAPIVLLLVLAATFLAVHTAGPDTGAYYAEEAYQQKDQQTQQIVDAGLAWCCPRDPSAPNVLQDRAMQAWAGDEGPLEETFGSWFVDPETNDFTVKASWAPRGGSGTHTIDLYRSAPSDGKTAGTQQIAEPPLRGPAFVLPRLDTVSAESSTDILVVPVDDIWPYRVGPRGAHEDEIETRVTYQRTSPGDSGTREVEMSGYTELTGAPRPAMDVHFAEPDWQRLAVEDDDLGFGFSLGDEEHAFTQVLSKEDLAAEKTLHNDNLLDDAQTVEDGQYPHHRFHVQVNLTGPGAIDAGNLNTADDGETRNLTEAYKLTVHVPRNWTDVQIKKPDDENWNSQHAWNKTRVQSLPSGGHRITSFLNVTAEFDVSGTERSDRPRWVLDGSTEIQAPFRFHARPPSDLASTNLGFQDIRAILESERFSARQSADLTVEVASSPGRVHRTLDTLTPNLVPQTPWANATAGIPEGVRLPVGAVLENGGEVTTVDAIEWTIPQAHGPLKDLRVLEDFSGGGTWSRIHDDGTLTVRWEPGSTSNPVCAQLQACAVAAELVLDGRGLNQRALWASPQLVSLYEEQDIQPYLDWFVRSQHAWEGIPLERDRPPGFAIGHRYDVADAGPAEGSYRFTVPPTLTPPCEDEDIKERDKADRRREGDRAYYDLGPREDGLLHADPSLTCTVAERTFTAIAEMGDRYRTQAIGKHDYRSLAGLTGQTVADWQNGLAESSLEADDEVRAGRSLRYTVKIDSLLDLLAQDEAISTATVEAKIFDPYNAWENTPWLTKILRETTGFGEISRESLGEAFEIDDGDSQLPSCDEVTRGSSCASANTGEPIPPYFTDRIPIRKSMVPGTHLLVIEISWTFTSAGGTSITETGRLIEPFDILSPQGDRVQGAAIGVTAWDTDWR